MDCSIQNDQKSLIWIPALLESHKCIPGLQELNFSYCVEKFITEVVICIEYWKAHWKHWKHISYLNVWFHFTHYNGLLVTPAHRQYHCKGTTWSSHLMSVGVLFWWSAEISVSSLTQSLDTPGEMAEEWDGQKFPKQIISLFEENLLRTLSKVFFIKWVECNIVQKIKLFLIVSSLIPLANLLGRDLVFQPSSWSFHCWFPSR